jgi:hypothetical protein
MEPKKLSEITRKEWIMFAWLEACEFGEERSFIRGNERTPEEALQAAEEWDFLQSVKDGGDGE